MLMTTGEIIRRRYREPTGVTLPAWLSGPVARKVAGTLFDIGFYGVLLFGLWLFFR